MILLIDNYDSFSYNLYQLVGSITPDIRVVRNDAVTVRDLRALARCPYWGSAWATRPSARPSARAFPTPGSSCTASSPG